jgi:hypothetical protein
MDKDKIQESLEENNQLDKKLYPRFVDCKWHIFIY